MHTEQSLDSYMAQKTLLNSKDIHIILHRLACQLLENHIDFSNTVLIGLQPRGIFLANRIAQILKEEYHINNIQLGQLDITFLEMILEEEMLH